MGTMTRRIARTVTMYTVAAAMPLGILQLLNLSTEGVSAAIMIYETKMMTNIPLSSMNSHPIARTVKARRTGV